LIGWNTSRMHLTTAACEAVSANRRHSTRTDGHIRSGGSLMERRTKIGVVLALVLTLIVGVVIGGLGGRGVNEYLARLNPSPAALPVAQPVSSTNKPGNTQAPTAAPTPIGDATLAPADRSGVQAVKQ